MKAACSEFLPSQYVSLRPGEVIREAEFFPAQLAKGRPRGRKGVLGLWACRALGWGAWPRLTPAPGSLLGAPPHTRGEKPRAGGRASRQETPGEAVPTLARPQVPPATPP